MTIKIAGKSDLESLFELNKLFENDAAKEEMEMLLGKNDNELVAIAYFDGYAAGFCTGLVIRSICYKKSRLDIESLFVKEEYRKKGIGRALVEFIEKEASLRKINHFHITVNKEKTGAIKLYESAGYANTGEILLDKTL